MATVHGCYAQAAPAPRWPRGGLAGRTACTASWICQRRRDAGPAGRGARPSEAAAGHLLVFKGERRLRCVERKYGLQRLELLYETFAVRTSIPGVRQVVVTLVGDNVT